MTAKEWNEKYSVGQDVYLTEDDGTIIETQTRSEAWNLGYGVSVIKVVGKSGGFLLRRIQANENHNKRG